VNRTKFGTVARLADLTTLNISGSWLKGFDSVKVEFAIFLSPACRR